MGSSWVSLPIRTLIPSRLGGPPLLAHLTLITFPSALSSNMASLGIRASYDLGKGDTIQFVAPTLRKRGIIIKRKCEILDEIISSNMIEKNMKEKLSELISERY